MSPRPREEREGPLRTFELLGRSLFRGGLRSARIREQIVTRCHPSSYPQDRVSSGALVPASAPRPAFCLSRLEDDPGLSLDVRRPPIEIPKGRRRRRSPLASRVEAFDARLSSMAPDCSWADDLHLTERTLEVAAFESLKCIR